MDEHLDIEDKYNGSNFLDSEWWSALILVCDPTINVNKSLQNSHIPVVCESHIRKEQTFKTLKGLKQILW